MSNVNYEIRTDLGYFWDEPMFKVAIRRDGKIRGYLRRKDGMTRMFSNRNGARKAIWRERNGDFSS